MTHERQHGRWYARPEPDDGRSWTPRMVWRAMWWHLGFDPLPTRERLHRTRTERDYWQTLASKVTT